jgi:hypothetical protein
VFDVNTMLYTFRDPPSGFLKSRTWGLYEALRLAIAKKKTNNANTPWLFYFPRLEGLPACSLQLFSHSKRSPAFCFFIASTSFLCYFCVCFKRTRGNITSECCEHFVKGLLLGCVWELLHVKHVLLKLDIKGHHSASVYIYIYILEFLFCFHMFDSYMALHFLTDASLLL